MARPKSNVTKTPAEKMREYRERQKAKNQGLDLMEEVKQYFEEEEVTLRKYFEYWAKQGQKMEVVQENGLKGEFRMLKLMRRGQWHGDMDRGLFIYLVLKGSLVLIRDKGEGWNGGKVYEFSS